MLCGRTESRDGSGQRLRKQRQRPLAEPTDLANLRCCRRPLDRQSTQGQVTDQCIGDLNKQVGGEQEGGQMNNVGVSPSYSGNQAGSAHHVVPVGHLFACGTQRSHQSLHLSLSLCPVRLYDL